MLIHYIVFSQKIFVRGLFERSKWKSPLCGMGHCNNVSKVFLLQLGYYKSFCSRAFLSSLWLTFWLVLFSGFLTLNQFPGCDHYFTLQKLHYTTEVCLCAKVVEMNSVSFEGRRESCLLVLLPKGVFVEIWFGSLLVADLHIREMPSTGKVITCWLYNVLLTHEVFLIICVYVYRSPTII